jgi:hypothetical protein
MRHRRATVSRRTATLAIERSSRARIPSSGRAALPCVARHLARGTCSVRRLTSLPTVRGGATTVPLAAAAEAEERVAFVFLGAAAGAVWGEAGLGWQGRSGTRCRRLGAAGAEGGLATHCQLRPSRVCARITHHPEPQ